MTHEQDRKRLFDPGNFPALLEFLPAYLHQDFGEEYGSAAEAVAALVSDATGGQIRIVKEEWFGLRQMFAGQPLDDIQRALGALGAAWQPQSEQELQGVDEILSRGEA